MTSDSKKPIKKRFRGYIFTVSGMRWYARGMLVGMKKQDKLLIVKEKVNLRYKNAIFTVYTHIKRKWAIVKIGTEINKNTKTLIFIPIDSK